LKGLELRVIKIYSGLQKRPSVKKYGTFSDGKHDEIGDASPEEHLIF